MDKNIRNIPNLNIASMNQDLLGYGSVSRVLRKDNLSSNFNMTNFNSANMNWADKKCLSKVLSTNLTLPNNATAFFSNSSDWFFFNYDRVSRFVGLETPAMLKGREELTPDYIFNTY
jgi:hypothetical protein